MPLAFMQAMGIATAIDGNSRRSLSAYESMVRSLSDRLVEAQRPIRILDAIKWDDQVEKAFFERGCRELPPVNRDYYLSRPLPFSPEQKYHEFHAIERDIRRQLGEFNAPGHIMSRMCDEYCEVVSMLSQRGTRRVRGGLGATIRQRQRQFSRRRSQPCRPRPHDVGHS